jgi:regulator of replication initiation timing
VTDLALRILELLAAAGVGAGLWRGAVWLLRTSDRSAKQERDASDQIVKQWYGLLEATQNRLTATEQELAAIRQRRDTDDSEKDRLQRENAELRGQATALKGEIDLLKLQVLRLQDEITSWQAREARHQAIEQENYEQDQKLVRQEWRLQLVSADVSRAKDENLHLRRENRALRKRLQGEVVADTDQLPTISLVDVDAYVREGDLTIDPMRFVEDEDNEDAG